MGGGSSDAVGVLKGLAVLFQVDDEIALLELAAELGSDCPLFLKGEPVLMRGRGEKLEPLDEKEEGRSTERRSLSLSPLWNIDCMGLQGFADISPNMLIRARWRGVWMVGVMANCHYRASCKTVSSRWLARNIHLFHW